MKRLKIITTGGTIDKLYFDDASEYKIGQPVIGDLLNSFNVAFKFEVLSLTFSLTVVENLKKTYFIDKCSKTQFIFALNCCIIQF